MSPPRRRLPVWWLHALMVVVVAGGCGAERTAERPTTRPVATTTRLPPAGAAVVTFEVAGTERFSVLVVDAAIVARAQRMLAGEEPAAVPIGRVRRGDGGVNAPWHWHLDPRTFAFADATTEVCDGLPSFVEAGGITSEWYCPWSARVVAVAPAAGR